MHPFWLDKSTHPSSATCPLHFINTYSTIHDSFNILHFTLSSSHPKPTAGLIKLWLNKSTFYSYLCILNILEHYNNWIDDKSSTKYHSSTRNEERKCFNTPILHCSIVSWLITLYAYTFCIIWGGERKMVIWIGWQHTTGCRISTHSFRWHFAMLTNADGKTCAVLLIVYEWLWMLGHNVITLGLYGWQGCTRGNQWWRKQCC